MTTAPKGSQQARFRRETAAAIAGHELGRRGRGWRAKFVPEDEDVVKGRYRLDGGIVEVGKDFGIDVRAAVDRAIEENSGRKPRILGGGCGLGVLEKELKQAFGNRVEVHALDLRLRPEWREVNRSLGALNEEDWRRIYGKQNGVLSESDLEKLRRTGVVFHVGHVEGLRKLASKAKFDLIFLPRTLDWSAHPVKALRQAYDALEEGGTLHAQIEHSVRILNEDERNDLVSFDRKLESNGVARPFFVQNSGCRIYSIKKPRR